MASIRAYLDNVIASGAILNDVADPDERAATSRLVLDARVGKFQAVASDWARREMERTRDQGKRKKLLQDFENFDKVEAGPVLQGYNTLTDHIGTWICNPLMSDAMNEETYEKLRQIGLKKLDALHLEVALANSCNRFVTTDPHFIDRKAAIESAFPSVRIMKPSELLKEIQAN